MDYFNSIFGVKEHCHWWGENS